MKKPLRIALLGLALGTLVLPATAAEKKSDDPVVARVNGAKIYRSQILRELQAMGAHAAQLPPNVLYPKLLNKAIVTKLVSSKGYAAKMQKDPEVKKRLKDSEDEIVADIYVRKTIQPKITDAKIKARYKKLSGKFKPQDEIRARHILVKTEKEAKALLKKIKNGDDFAKIAMEKSQDKGSAKQGGDLGYFTRKVMVKPFADAAFKLKAGGITDKPVKTDFGYHIIKAEDRRKSSPPPLSEVKDQIMGQVGQELVEKMINGLKAKAKIEKFNIDGTPIKKEKKAKKK
ncbi:MAG TPA: peptidylprolyl isomerase [Rhodospirillaceae bacterium]|nr:peptidylprolyl isomerase [Rhodospirillaceae bacterium]